MTKNAWLVVVIISALAACSADETGQLDAGSYSPPARCQRVAAAWCAAELGCTGEPETECVDRWLQICVDEQEDPPPSITIACVEALEETCALDGTPAVCEDYCPVTDPR